ncbi:translocation/assembly module TamB domain-containing protein [soil metagenome]
MTDPTEPDVVAEAEAVETPAKVEKRRRTRKQLAFFIAGCLTAALAIVVLVTLIGGRMYLLSDSGRGLVTSFISGQKISRYGRINVEGVTGDLFDDFTIRRLTITDRKGVWLEASNVRVDWSYPALILRRFHATDISAASIKLVRRPEIDPPDGKPPQPSPISVDIDKFGANVELLEGFSKEYGRWRLTGSADIPRFGDKDATVNAWSLNRPGDFLRLTATFGGKVEDMRLNLNASEAQGGPIAGSLGYSPDQPFVARALVNGEIVDAVVRTGSFTPLTIKGRYGKAGARISGYADFGGSDLFKPFVDRIGRTARFGFAMVPDATRKDFQGVAWRLYAENLTSSAQGMVRLSDRSVPDGVKLDVSTPSLSRLVGFKLADQTAWSGVFTGDVSKWALNGRIDLRNTDLISYRSARIAGALNVRAVPGRYDFDTDAQVSGGVTDGLIGALLGRTPHVKLEAAMLKDGAFLFEHLNVQGQALTFDGTGNRNLLGGLGFRGNARVTDFGKILPDATGQIGGRVTAVSPRNGAPWAITFDGRGSRLMTHQDETDRLMGQTPGIKFVGVMKDNKIYATQGLVTGAAGQGNAWGVMGFDGSLKFKLDWNAHGPFGIGPIAIDGAMTGKGDLTGTLAEPRVDLTALFDKVAIGPLTLTNTNMLLTYHKGLNDRSDGHIQLDSGSNYGPATASATFFLDPKAIRLTDVDLNAGGVVAKGAIALSDNVPSSADMTFSARPGAFIASGSAEGRVRLVEGTGDDTAILDVTARNARLAGTTWTVRSLDLNGHGTLTNLPFTLAMDVGGATPVQFNGGGVYSRNDVGQAVTLRGGGRVREVAFTTRNPAVITLMKDGHAARFDLGVGGGVLTGALRQTAEAVVLDADLSAVELGSIAPDLRGSVTGRVSLRGAGSDLTGSANVALAQVRSVDAPTGLAVDGALNATLTDNVLRVQANAHDDAAVRASVDLTLPVEASAAPLRLAIVRTRPMSGQVQMHGQIQPIWDLFLGGERSLAGQVDIDAAIAGTMAAPRINGSMTVAQGSFRDNATGVALNGVTLNGRFDDTTALIETFTANDGSGGTVSGDGRIGLREGSESSLELTLTRFRIIDNEIAEARASGPVTVLRGEGGNISLAGQMVIDEARIEANPPGENGVVRMDVIEINKPGGDEPEDEQTRRQRGPQFNLDIGLRSNGTNVRVVGRGLNVVLGVNAQVTGTIATPILTGNARIIRGDYEFAGKRFVFDDRGTVSLSTDPAKIRLNLSAVREDPALTATIRVTGTALSPEIALTSTPQLPQDEILSQVLFGRSASQLSPFEAAQLAAGVASLAGGGGFDVIGNLRELAGLDRLSFGGEASALTVAGGRYITKDVYLEIIGGGEGGAAVNVEWQVRRNLAISSKFGGTGEATLSIRWRRQTRQPGSRPARPEAARP